MTTKSKPGSPALRLAGAIIEVTHADLEKLPALAAASPAKRSRICLHQSDGDLLQQMVIYLMAESYCAPHKHSTKAESFQIIRGELDVLIFSDDGRLERIVALGDPSTGKPFLYRLAPGIYHTVFCHQGSVLFHEITEGPFDPSRKEPAPFGPPESDREAGLEYLRNLLHRI